MIGATRYPHACIDIRTETGKAVILPIAAPLYTTMNRPDMHWKMANVILPPPSSNVPKSSIHEANLVKFQLLKYAT